MNAPWQTDLILGSVVIPYGSARNLRATLSPIDNGEVRRTINGGLVDLTRTTHRKYSLQISGDDQIAPALADIWRGQLLTVRPPIPLRQTISSSGSVTLQRPVASEADVKAFTAGGTQAAFGIFGQSVFVPSLVGLPGYVEYLPTLTMRVMERSEERQEWAASASWSLTLEEV